MKSLTKFWRGELDIVIFSRLAHRLVSSASPNLNPFHLQQLLRQMREWLGFMRKGFVTLGQRECQGFFEEVGLPIWYPWYLGGRDDHYRNLKSNDKDLPVEQLTIEFSHLEDSPLCLVLSQCLLNCLAIINLSHPKSNFAIISMQSLKSCVQRQFHLVWHKMLNTRGGWPPFCFSPSFPITTTTTLDFNDGHFSQTMGW